MTSSRTASSSIVACNSESTKSQSRRRALVPWLGGWGGGIFEGVNTRQAATLDRQPPAQSTANSKCGLLEAGRLQHALAHRRPDVGHDAIEQCVVRRSVI